MSLTSDDIHETFLCKRQILIQEEIKDPVQERVCRSIFYLNLQNDSPITLLIDSGGGFATPGMYVCDAVSNSKAQVDGLVVGAACSMAFAILQHCKNRRAYEHARLMFHSIRIDDVAIDRMDFEEYIADIKRRNRELLDLYRRRSRQPIAKIKKWSRSEKFFGAGEAFESGFIDEIVR